MKRRTRPRKFPEEPSSAIISQCGKYRYRLERFYKAQGIVFGYFGVNPSTADDSADDATVRKWRGFTERNGGRGFVVGNVFAYRATNIKELANVRDPVGGANDYHISEIIERCDVLVPCWGDTAKVPRHLRPQFERLEFRLTQCGKPVFCFGLTRHAHPKHPLMLAYKTRLEPFVTQPIGILTNPERPSEVS